MWRLTMMNERIFLEQLFLINETDLKNFWTNDKNFPTEFDALTHYCLQYITFPYDEFRPDKLITSIIDFDKKHFDEFYENKIPYITDFLIALKIYLFCYLNIFAQLIPVPAISQEITTFLRKFDPKNTIQADLSEFVIIN